MSLRTLLDRLQATRPARAWSRVNDARGGILAGGIAYFGFFSLVPALTVGFTVFGYVIGGDLTLQRQVAQRVNASLGYELIGTRPGHGVVLLADLVQQGVLTATGVFGLIALGYAGMGWLEGTREGIRAVLGLPPMANPWLAKGRDLLALVLLGLTVLASLVAGFAVSTATGLVAQRLGWSGTGLDELAVTTGSTLVLLVVDTGIFLLFLAVLADAPVPVADLRSAAVLGAVGMQLLKDAAGLLVHRVSHHPVLASSVVLVGLLIWMNLAARLTLLVAGWAATTAADRGHLPGPARPAVGAGTMGPVGTAYHGRGERTMAAEIRETREGRGAAAGTEPWSGRPVLPELPALPPRGGPAPRLPRHLRRRPPVPLRPRPEPVTLSPTVGQRAQDRVTLAAGIVLGAVGLVTLRVLRRGLRTAWDAVRGH